MADPARPRYRRRRFIGLTVVAVLLAGGLYWFQPWRLWTTTEVHDQLPVLAGPATSGTPPTGQPPVAQATVQPDTVRSAIDAATSAPVAAPKTPTSTATGPVELARGSLISHEHDTSGTVRLIALTDGNRVLTLEGLRTSDGPALHVWLTDADVIAGEDGWHVFDDGRHVDLGTLKGNVGDQLYPLPAGLDLGPLTSVTIWCDRFSVSFGAAVLTST